MLERGSQQASGGLVVLGSIHAELMALIENRDAPLYNRTTDAIELEHLDIESLLALLNAHCGLDLKNLLFLWSIFEGVPKFYRDAYEQGALGEAREIVLKKMFFRSSSPLRSEAENWFLHELRGRYDVVLNYIARHPGCSQAELTHHVQELSSSETRTQVGAYIKGLIEKFGLVESAKTLRLASCKRSPKKLIQDMDNFGGHVERFLASFPRYQDWKIERVGISVELSGEQRKTLSDRGVLAEDLRDLLLPFKGYREGSSGGGCSVET